MMKFIIFSFIILIFQNLQAQVLTEEPVAHSFAQALAGHIATRCFRDLDAAPQVVGSMDLPAIPLNEHLESAVLPSAHKVESALALLLNQ